MKTSLFKLASTALKTSKTDAAAGTSALEVAPGKTDWPLVFKLLESGKDSNAAHPETGCTFLMRAAQEGRCDVIKILVTLYYANPNAEDASGLSVLSYAALACQKEALDTLLACEADPLRPNRFGEPPLIQIAARAVSGEHYAQDGPSGLGLFCAFLQKAIPDEELYKKAINAQDPLGRTALHRVLSRSKQSEKAVADLIGFKINVDLCSKDGKSPTALAVEQDLVNILNLFEAIETTPSSLRDEELLKTALACESWKSFDVLAASSGLRWTDTLAVRRWMMDLAKEGRFDVIDRIFLPWAADVNKSGSEGTLLHQAISYRVFSFLPYLLQHGADPNLKKTSSGLTPILMILMTSAGETQDELVNIPLLVRAGASVRILNDDGKLPSEAASLCNLPQCAAFLREEEKRQRIKAPSRSARDALAREIINLAGSGGSLDRISGYLKAGANLDYRRPANKMPFLHQLLERNVSLVALEVILAMAGHKMNLRDRTGLSPLAYLFYNDQAKVVAKAELLIKRGADPNDGLYDGKPLFQALRHLNGEVLEDALRLLSRHKVTFDVRDERGHTALVNTPTKQIPLMLELGADPTFKNEDGRDFFAYLKDAVQSPMSSWERQEIKKLLPLIAKAANERRENPYRTIKSKRERAEVRAGGPT